ncbi:MAG: hypothetical protein COA88_10850 [Kordia sp.]|nr:MAG: hypothetical protein COA88_10850 [Kordia sp.]
MPDNSNIKHLLNNQAKKFDIEVPNSGHKARFIEKLAKKNTPEKKSNNNNYWYLNIAAAFIICIGSFSIYNSKNNTETSAVENPFIDISNAQFHLEGIVKRELVKLELERNTTTENIIDGALSQLEFLEQEQHKLEGQLKVNYDKRIIKALVDNFQYRIQLLENVMQQIEITKEIKIENYEPNVI